MSIFATLILSICLFFSCNMVNLSYAEGKYSPMEQLMLQQQIRAQKEAEANRSYDALLHSMSETASQDLNNLMGLYMQKEARAEDKELRAQERAENKLEKELMMRIRAQERAEDKEFQRQMATLGAATRSQAMAKDDAYKQKMLELKEREIFGKSPEGMILKDVGEEAEIPTEPLKTIKGLSGAEYMWNQQTKKLTKLGEKELSALAGLAKLDELYNAIQKEAPHQFTTILPGSNFFNKVAYEASGLLGGKKEREGTIQIIDKLGKEIELDKRMARGGSQAINSNIEGEKAEQEAIKAFDPYNVKMEKLRVLYSELASPLKRSGFNVPEKDLSLKTKKNSAWESAGAGLKKAGLEVLDLIPDAATPDAMNKWLQENIAKQDKIADEDPVAAFLGRLLVYLIVGSLLLKVQIIKRLYDKLYNIFLQWRHSYWLRIQDFLLRIQDFLISMEYILLYLGFPSWFMYLILLFLIYLIFSYKAISVLVILILIGLGFPSLSMLLLYFYLFFILSYLL